MSQVPGGGKFIKAVELQPGATAIIKDEANWIDSNFQKDDGTKQQQYVCTVEVNGEDRRLKLTMASCEALKDFGTDSKEWIGKKINLEAIKVMVGGSVKLSILATPFGSGIDQPGAKKPDETVWDDE